MSYMKVDCSHLNPDAKRLSLITSTILYHLHVRVFLTQRIGTKSHGAMSVECKGLCACGMWCLLENCCFTVSRHGMNFSNSCLMPTSLIKIAWRELKEISSCATTSLMISLQTALSKSGTVAVTSYVFNEGCPEHSSVLWMSAHLESSRSTYKCVYSLWPPHKMQF